MTAVRALRPRPGRWVRKRTSGMGGCRCVMCQRDAMSGWAFKDAGQVTTTSAFVCEGCADGLVKP